MGVHAEREAAMSTMSRDPAGGVPGAGEGEGAMNRRLFFKGVAALVVGGVAAKVAGALPEPEVASTRAFFLPPAGGWLPRLAFHRDAFAMDWPAGSPPQTFAEAHLAYLRSQQVEQWTHSERVARAALGASRASC